MKIFICAFTWEWTRRIALLELDVDKRVLTDVATLELMATSSPTFINQVKRAEVVDFHVTVTTEKPPTPIEAHMRYKIQKGPDTERWKIDDEYLV